MVHYSIEPRTKKYVKGCKFFYLQDIYLTNIENNYWIQE